MAGDRERTEQELLQRLRETFGGRPWIIAGEVAQGILGGAIALQSLGASDVIAIASRVGVGELTDEIRFILSDGTQVGDGASMVERMHDNNRELHDLPAWVIAEVDDWDPDRQAQGGGEFHHRRRARGQPAHVWSPHTSVGCA